ncbi:glycosyltransferase family 2 protein [Ornithinimicrobium pratense]|uniref:Glycosyltransferase family 2 protein n=1 Tax=Ornithinimicrobium pratense TaxID=2593973 RepID=A0A5J6V894_9MICO|nr:glycosyltransferase family 2 protein [Ornithinimicrobium pratense]QFG70025.1 glycosyltransferase family 2 protein [Ornithinimicrobium pratense]
MSAADPAEPAPAPTVHPVATRAGVTRDTARNQILLDHPDALAATALRTRSRHAREVLVEAAWPGRTAQDVDDWASRTTAGAGTPAIPEGADAYHLGQYARVLALQTLDPGDPARARVLLEALAACGQRDHLHPQAVQVLLHLRCLDRDAAGCADLLDHRHVPADVADAVRADLANPFLIPVDSADPTNPLEAADPPGPRAPEGDALARWLGLLDTALHSEQLAPLRLVATEATRVAGATPFDRLGTNPLPRADVDGDPLVTVVVSAYRPGPPLLTAVRSLLAQTWQRLEVLVIDDASGPDAQPWLRAAAELDPRVRVIAKAVNGGTYRARNTGLRQARGTFLTTLDSDDWLHPQAVATLVRTLEAEPSLVAARGLGARVTEDLALVKLGYRHRAVAAPTLLVRLDPALSRVGFFDPARKSADTEYARRLQAAFGEHSVRTVDECLLLLRSDEDSLSAGEFSRMWRHGARHAYKCLYTPWHEEIRAGAAAYLDPGVDRPVPEPRRWVSGAPRDPDLPPPRHLGLVLGGDWRRYGGPQRSMLEEIRAARAAGLRVGILHLEALRFATTRDLPLCAPVTELLRRREVEWVQVDDDVDVEVLLVRYPLVLQHPPTVPRPRPLRPRHLLVVANQAPLEPDGCDQRYVVTDVTERARELFGTDPVWVPQGPVIRDVLLAQDRSVRLTPWDNPGLIDVAEWRVGRERAPGAGGEPVVVGRLSRDHPLKHPATHADLLAAYDLGEGYAVRLMGSRATWKRLAVEAGLAEDTPVPQNWELLRVGAVEPREFLAGLDFFLYQDHPERHEAFGRVLLEAAAAGLVVVAHPKHRVVFGDLLDYAEPRQARDLIESYVAHPERYAARVERVLELVRQRYSHASFVQRLATLAGVREAWAGSRESRADRGRQWTGAAVVQVRPTGDRAEPIEVAVREGTGLRVRSVPLRSAADAGRADQLVLVEAQDLSRASRDRLRVALAVPDEASLDDEVSAAVAGSDDIPLALLVRDGRVHVLGEVTGGPATPVPGWTLAQGARELQVRR